MQFAAERADPVCDMDEGRGTRGAVVLHRQGDPAGDVDADPGRSSPGCVVDRLARRRVDGSLDRRVEPLVGRSEVDRQWRPVGERRERGREAGLGKDGRIDAVRKLAQLLERRLRLIHRRCQRPGELLVFVALGGGTREPQVE